MGIWRPLKRLSVILLRQSSSSDTVKSISSTTLFGHQANKETLIDTLGRNALFSQNSNSAKQVLLGTYNVLNFMTTTLAEARLEKTENGVSCEEKKLNVVFVLGGPGSGKGTQCTKIVEKYGFTHLSAGDLLRAEINSSSENGTMIQNVIKEGKIVPSEVTVNLVERAMRESGNHKFLIDGFPRNEENRTVFEQVTGIEPEFILFFDCPMKEMECRVLNRNQGRVDDNIETIRKRFKVFVESTLPVVDYYDSKVKVHKIDATGTKEDIFKEIKVLFEPYVQEKKKENDVRID
ncbi:UMP-CMP kinase 3 isoform X2 [Cryptomeria japonica]|uniref:UMP-CMP kinase 3 isoform X2 n=1 Tax=Cryptomeria japonica TaxID=3369 RepID=UPI0025AC883E|nr:UMP-CMP kinase 3 isoform X2 [Cryptomeria japonica]